MAQSTHSKQSAASDQTLMNVDPRNVSGEARASSIETPAIGYIVGGGLKENLRVRLTVPGQTVQEGAFVVVESGDWRFYGLVTDIRLGATDPRFADERSSGRLPPRLADMLVGQTVYTELEVLPALMLEVGPDPRDARAYEEWRASLESEPRPLPVKTIPPHQAPVRLASAGDVAEIFGRPGEKGAFTIGYTREQGHPVSVNLERLVQRSSGVFGATGTGKSFLTRLLLAGLIQAGRVSLLVFDMHNEYGPDSTSSDTGEAVAGLRGKFPGRVSMVGLGRDTSILGQTPDFHLELSEDDIAPEDIEMLTRELNLKETTPTVLEALIHSYHRNWFHEFKALRGSGSADKEGTVAWWATQNGVNVAAAEGLHGKLNRVFNREYIVSQAAGDGLTHIVRLLQDGKHVVLSFGDHESDLDYLLVTNVLTRRIRAAWVEMTEAYHRERKVEPRPLVIVLEEAHKLLNREMAGQTAFSVIARELRKYYVTLLVVDQRPSQIYDEVMSQLGTRISGWLGDEADIQAVLSGLAGRDALRGMLARLQPKEEVLLLGWGVPMPLPVRSRRYDARFWEELKGVGKKGESQILKELGF